MATEPEPLLTEDELEKLSAMADPMIDADSLVSLIDGPIRRAQRSVAES